MLENRDSYVFSALAASIDGKYKYVLQQLDTTNLAMSQFWSIQPLKNLDVDFLQLIPDELIDKPYEITFTVGETVYSYLGNQ